MADCSSCLPLIGAQSVLPFCFNSCAGLELGSKCTPLLSLFSALLIFLLSLLAAALLKPNYALVKCNNLSMSEIKQEQVQQIQKKKAAFDSVLRKFQMILLWESCGTG